MPRRYWLLKSDPETFGWQDLERAPGRRTVWDGIRNYQARNLLRDEVRKGDGILFYHSQTDKAVMGTGIVTQAGFPEPGKLPWYAIEIELAAAFTTPLTLDAMRAVPALAGMVLLKPGSRLSIQPVSAAEWAVVTKLGARSSPEASSGRARRTR